MMISHAWKKQTLICFMYHMGLPSDNLRFPQESSRMESLHCVRLLMVSTRKERDLLQIINLYEQQ